MNRYTIDSLNNNISEKSTHSNTTEYNTNSMIFIYMERSTYIHGLELITSFVEMAKS